ncbi:hypothetical protein T08_12081 [Trichinella sp. T8]|nr:hypothetical protein T08_12081 [Trichinella sp. T8]
MTINARGTLTLSRILQPERLEQLLRSNSEGG